MSSDSLAGPPVSSRSSVDALIAAMREHWMLVVGVMAMALPTLVDMASQSWATEAGAHGPIVLATGLWLLWHIRGELMEQARPAPTWVVVVGLLLLVPAYALGRALDLLVIEAGCAYGMTLLAFLRLIGARAMSRHIFPFLYLGFLVPPPGWVLDAVTSPLRRGISAAATWILDLTGLPVVREGVVIYVGPYQLLVEDACSGINSLIGLTAISLFYIYLLHRANWQHAILLMLAVIPIAIIANLLRVMALIVITYFFGDAVGQGFVHGLAGIMLFALALAMVVGTDFIIQRLLGRRYGMRPA